MTYVILIFVAFFLVVLAALLLLRWSDQRDDAKEWARLAALQQIGRAHV